MQGPALTTSLYGFITAAWGADNKVQFVQYVAGLAVVSALQEIFTDVCGISPSPDVFPIKLKWPNDIYANTSDGRLLKIGGVLVTAVHQGSQLCASVGLGLNVSNLQPTTCVHTVLTELGCDTPLPDIQVHASREHILATFLHHLEDFIEVNLIRACQYPAARSHSKRRGHAGSSR